MNKKIEAIIIDDETRGIVVLEQMLQRYCPNVSVSGKATKVADAVPLIRSADPDIVFLDIEMPGENGFRLFDYLSDPEFETIFVTAYQEHAIRAIRLAAIDYLLKPVKAEDLISAVARAEKRIEESVPAVNDAVPHREGRSVDRLVLSTTQGYYPIRTEDIIYCRADDSYTHFCLTTGKSFTVSHSLKEYDDMLSAGEFFRVHKSFLVNLKHIDYVTKADGGFVVMSNKDEVPVSSRKKEAFLQRLRAIG